MVSADELRALLIRLETAARPDRDLDRDVFVAAFGHGVRNSLPLPEFTSTETEIFRLIERILPGWAWKLGTCSVSDDAWLVPDVNCPTHGERLKKQFGHPESVPPRSILDSGIDFDRRPSGQPALAMCEAFISALIGIQGQVA